MQDGLLMQYLTRPEEVGEWELPEANRLLHGAQGLEKGTEPRDEMVGMGVGLKVENESGLQAR